MPVKIPLMAAAGDGEGMLSVRDRSDGGGDGDDGFGGVELFGKAAGGVAVLGGDLIGWDDISIESMTSMSPLGSWPPLVCAGIPSPARSDLLKSLDRPLD